MNASGLDTILNALRGESSSIVGDKSGNRGENAEFLAAFDAASKAASSRDSRPTNPQPSQRTAQASTDRSNGVRGIDAPQGSSAPGRTEAPNTIEGAGGADEARGGNTLPQSGSEQSNNTTPVALQEQNTADNSPATDRNPGEANGADTDTNSAGTNAAGNSALDAAKAPGNPALLIADNNSATRSGESFTSQASPVAQAVQDIVATRQGGAQLGTPNPQLAPGSANPSVDPETLAANSRAFADAVRQAATGAQTNSGAANTPAERAGGQGASPNFSASPPSGAALADSSLSSQPSRTGSSSAQGLGASVTAQAGANVTALREGTTPGNGVDGQSLANAVRQASAQTANPGAAGHGEQRGQVVAQGSVSLEAQSLANLSDGSDLSPEVAARAAARQAASVQPNEEERLAADGTELRTLRSRAEMDRSAQVRPDSGLLGRSAIDAESSAGNSRLTPSDTITRNALASGMTERANSAENAQVQANSATPEQRFARFANAIRASEPASPPPVQAAELASSAEGEPLSTGLQGTAVVAGSPLGETIKGIAQGQNTNNLSAGQSADGSISGVERPTSQERGTAAVSGLTSDAARGPTLDDQLAEVGGDDARLPGRVGEPTVSPDGNTSQRGFESALSQSMAQGVQPTATSSRAADSTSQLMSSQPDLNNAPDSPEFPQEILGRVRMLQNQGTQEARLNLHPAELGRMQISITTEGDSTRVAFTVENPHARDALEQAMPRLREMLNQAGLQLADSTVAHQGQQGASSFGSDSQGERGTGTGVSGSADAASDTESSGRKPADPDRAIDAYA